MVEGDGETWFPHPPARGLRSPKPSRGRGRGETRFPHTPLRGPMFTLGRSIRFLSTLLLPHRHGFGRAALDGAVSRRPAPAQTRPRWGREPGATPQRGEAGRGAERCERWSPQPSMRLRRTPTGGKYFLGGRSPPKPSHRVGVWGNQGSPYPCSRALPSHTLPRAEAGETGFPQPPAQGLRPYLPGGGGVGEPGSPMFTSGQRGVHQGHPFALGVALEQAQTGGGEGGFDLGCAGVENAAADQHAAGGQGRG